MCFCVLLLLKWVFCNLWLTSMCWFLIKDRKCALQNAWQNYPCGSSVMPHKMISIGTFRKFSEANVFLFSFNRTHMIPVRVRNMAAPAILFHNVISIGLIDLSVSASHTCRCHAPEEWVWTAPLCSFPTNDSANVCEISYFRTKMLAIVNWGKKLYHPVI